MPEPTAVNYANIELRPIRYRHPLSSELMQDTLDMVYWNLVDLLGYVHEDGTISPSGMLSEINTNIHEVGIDYMGAAASGYTYPLSIASGYVENVSVNNNNLIISTRALIYDYN
jgi:hypothetical protein